MKSSQHGGSRARFARDESIGDKRLCQAVVRAEEGSIDADLGGGLIKQRVSNNFRSAKLGYIVANRADGPAAIAR